MMKAGYHTSLSVYAKDGTLRDVAISADDTPEVIGEQVIAAINGTSLFQLSTLKCNDCRNYMTRPR